jgi:hypothetical protein
MLASNPNHDAPMRNGYHREMLPGVGFDDAGAPVRVGHFDWDGVEEAPEAQAHTRDETAARQETVSRIMDLLVRDARNAEHIGRRCVLLAFVAKCPTAPKSESELGEMMGVTRQRAHQLLADFRAKLQCLQGD